MFEPYFSPTPILARRVWWRVEGELRSLVVPTRGFRIYAPQTQHRTSVIFEKFPWSDGWNEARCNHEDHVAPNPNCGCGFWGLKEDKEDIQIFSFKQHYRDGSYVVPNHIQLVEGYIEMKGTVVEFERGYRSQFARPILETIEHVAHPKTK